MVIPVFENIILLFLTEGLFLLVILGVVKFGFSFAFQMLGNLLLKK